MSALPGFPYRAMDGENTCGPTALASVLEFLGIAPADMETVWGFRRGTDRTDTPGHHLRALCRLEVPVAMRQGLTLDMIAAAVAAGRPVVVLVTVGRLLRHWIVVTGVDDDSVTVAWGDSTEPRVMSRDEFSRIFSHGLLDILMGTRRLGYVVGGSAPWAASRLLECWSGLIRPIAEHVIVPLIELVCRRRPH